MMNVIKYFKSLFNSDEVINKDFILQKLIAIKVTMESNTLPALTQLRAVIPENKEKDRETLDILSQFNIKVSKVSDGVDELIRFAKVMIDHTGGLYAIVKEDLPKFVTVDTMTAKQYAIMDAIDDAYSVCNFIDVLALELTYKLTDADPMYKVQEREIRDAARLHGKVYKELITGSKRVLNDLKKLSDTRVGDSEVAFDAVASKLDQKHLIGKAKFRYNPIYHILRWWEDVRYEIHKSNENRMKLLELKLQELEALKNSTNPPENIYQQIEYYEDQIIKLDKVIKAYEEDVWES